MPLKVWKIILQKAYNGEHMNFINLMDEEKVFLQLVNHWQNIEKNNAKKKNNDLLSKWIYLNT